MIRFLTRSSALILVTHLASAAQAADIAPVPTVYDWTGAYVGLNLGVAWGNSEVDTGIACSDIDSDYCSVFEDDLSIDLDDLRVGADDSGAAFTGGAMIGYNWQMDSFVLGAEADINYAGFGESNNRDLSLLASDIFGEDIDASHRAEFDADWWGTLRGRIGFAADNLLFYGTGGLAWGHIEASSRIDACWNGCIDLADSLRYGGSISDTNFGWTLGAGMEAGFDSWSLGVEYLYVDLGSADWHYSGDISDLTDGLPVDDVEFRGNGSVDYQFSVVRATAKWNF